eukprot:Lankesteria_metandrocarpae@DN5265_c1_g1_i1.p1
MARLAWAVGGLCVFSFCAAVRSSLKCDVWDAPLVLEEYRPSTGSVICFYQNRPQNVLLVKRKGTYSVTQAAVKLAQHLVGAGCMLTVYIEASSDQDFIEQGFTAFSIWEGGVDLDFVISLGGDGTLLWVSRLFNNYVPPILAISMGSLGYMAQFTIDEAESTINKMLSGSFEIQLRRRLKATVHNSAGEVVGMYVAMNDCVLERGGFSQLTGLEVYSNGEHFTNVAADGICIATPTGSTAYSMSAGGSMVHPAVPCMLFTPICPHSLSFRPVILPASVILEFRNPTTSRGSVMLNVDGVNQNEIKQGMSVTITLTGSPVPVVTPQNTEGDPWLLSLQRILNWNHKIRTADIPLPTRPTS